tara:strand:- start:803 stop:1384 length:582 start_codon:yes stop_codon:yes gene_type:complete
MHDYPLDIRGLILRHLYPKIEYRWVAPFLWDGIFDIREHIIDQISIRKYQILLEVDCSGFGRIVPRAAGIAARQGRITLAGDLLSAHMLGIRPDMALEARALSLLTDEKRMVKRLLNRNREWPKDVWNLQDTPAWMIPPFIRKFRTVVNSRTVTIISGGHLLASGNWVWSYPEKSHIASDVTISYNLKTCEFV